jgi:acyl-CoA thioesterase FadM
MGDIAAGSHRFVVYEIRIRFRAPARLGERLDIRTRVERSSGYRVVFHQEATRAADAATIASADVDAVLRAQADLVRVVRRLRPVLSFKGT